MKKLLLLNTALLIIAINIHAQVCTPTWPNGAGPGISPNVTTGLPAATVNQPYTTVLQFKVPKDTTYNSIPVTISNITIDNVVGLSTIPASTGFTYQCNPANCVFIGDSVCCISISGTPNTLGTYPFDVFVTIHIGSFFAIPDTVTGYHIDVIPNAGIENYSANAFQVFQNSPNPFSNSSDVCVKVPTAGTIEFMVYDILGNELLMKNFSMKPGINAIPINRENFPSGVYFYSVSFGEEKIMRRMLID